MKTKHITTITTVLVIILALLSFILSYASLQHMAATNGIDGWLAYLWPLLLDFAMMIFAMAILRVNLRNDGAGWYPWALTIAFAGLATLSNVLDVSTFGIPAIYVQVGVKALPPIALALSFHLLMEMVKSEVERSELDASIGELTLQVDALTQDRETLADKVTSLSERSDTLRSEVSDLVKARREAKRQPSPANDTFTPGDMDALGLANETRQGQIVERRNRVNELLGQQMTHGDIANELEVSISTVKRDVAALNGNGSAPTIDPPF